MNLMRAPVNDSCGNNIVPGPRSENTDTLGRWKQLLNSAGAIQRYEPEALLLTPASPARKSFLVEAGVIALTHYLSSGKQVFLALCSPGQIFGHSRHVLNHSFEVSANALTRSTVRAFDSQWLVDQIRRGGDAGILLMEQHSSDLHESGATLIDLIHLDASVRFERFLLQFAQASGAKMAEEVQVHIPLTDGYLAALLGISAQQFSAVKRKLAAEGKVRHIRETQTWIFGQQNMNSRWANA